MEAKESEAMSQPNQEARDREAEKLERLATHYADDEYPDDMADDRGIAYLGFKAGWDASKSEADAKDERIKQLELQLSLEKRIHDMSMENEERLEGRIAELEREVENLKAIVNAFKHWGTDGCTSCESGRITLWAANTKCISCDPESYEMGAPLRAYREALGGPNAEAGEGE